MDNVKVKNRGTKAPLVYVIVLSWNGIEHLPTCLGSLRRLSYDNVKVILVDNGSTDGSGAYVRANFPEVEILRLERNIGFAAGNNAGMERALSGGAEYLILLNNDMEVEPDWVTALVDRAESDPSIGACATKMLYFHNREIIQGIGICINVAGITWDHGNGRYDEAGPRIDDEVVGACGGAFFVRAAALRKTGLFDPRYFIYLEDLDLSMRIWDAGYRIVTVSEARAYHKFSATMVEYSYRKNYLTDRNRLRFILKNYPLRMIPPCLRDLFLWQCGSARDNYWRGDYRMILNQLRAVGGFLLQSPSAITARLSRGPVRSPRVWSLVKRDPHPARIRLPRRPHEDWEHGSESAVDMGSPPAQLGPGWYRMFDDRDCSFRWFANEAFLSLRNPSIGPLTLAIEIGNDHRGLGEISLSVDLDGDEIGTFTPGAGWNTYRLPVTPSEKESSVVRLRADSLYSADETGELTDLSFKVKRIELLSVEG